MKRHPRQRGVILIAALAVLLMLTFLSIGMFRGFGLEEKITGNAREKQHAFYATQTALQYAEQQLLLSGVTKGVTCTSSGLAAGSLTICDSTGWQNPDVYAVLGNWTNGTILGTTTYPLPTGFTFGTTSSGSATYLYQQPLYQVADIGKDPGTNGGELYVITAMGYGANANSQAVVQSVYSVVPSSQQVSK